MPVEFRGRGEQPAMEWLGKTVWNKGRQPVGAPQSAIQVRGVAWAKAWSWESTQVHGVCKSEEHKFLVRE